MKPTLSRKQFIESCGIKVTKRTSAAFDAVLLAVDLFCAAKMDRYEAEMLVRRMARGTSAFIDDRKLKTIAPRSKRA